MPGLNISQESVQYVTRLLKVGNLINAGLLIACGVLKFFGPSILNLPVVLSAIYVIMFGCLLCCFEVHLKRFDQYVFLNFGFMFYWYGRMLFFFFVATLALGLGIFGIIVGSITIINIFFTIYVMRVHPAYAQYVKDKNEEYFSNAQSSATNQHLAEEGKAGMSLGQGINAMNKVAGGDASMQDYKDAAKFANENKDTIKQGAEFYSENKETIDAGVKMANAANKP